jgi:dipeptidyl aminopeptidase/acylaminoacyl peptidase
LFYFKRESSMIRTGLAVSLLSLLCFVASVAAQEQSAATSATPGAPTLTPEFSLTLRSISDLQYAPDGTRAAFIVTEPPKGERRARHIWLFEKQSGAVRQFTYSAKSESSPRWSPDGKRLAFLSNRDGDDQQIYLMRADGGEAAAITKGKRSVSNFAWAPDGKQIAFLAPDAKTEAEEKKEKDKDDARVEDKDEKHARLWLLNVPDNSATASTAEPKALTQPNWELRELAWLPSGDRVVVAATDHPESDQETHRIFAVQVSDGSMKQVAAPRGPFGELRVSPDGKTVSYLGCREDGPSPHDLTLLDLGTHAARNLTGASLDRPIGEYQWKKDGSLVGLLADGFHNKFFSVTSAGVLQDGPPALPENPSAFAVSASGEILFTAQAATAPEEVWLWDGGTAARLISHINKDFSERYMYPLETFKYKSFDGTEIEAGLLKPGSPGGKPLPLIALIHGGPTGSWEDRIDTWGQLLAARGYAVFYPNVRGSTGYGEKFMEMNRGDWGGGDFKDVMAGIDDLVKRGIADPNKLGIGGWSYGGYMSEWAITQTTRFKAAVSGAGLANLISEYGTEKGPSYDEWFYGVPYEPEKITGFLNSSPFVYLKNAKTPTLILQGSADDVDPLGQSQELYRGLKRYGVEAELVVYPREPHGFHEEKHLLDRINRILAWYDKHLK